MRRIMFGLAALAGCAQDPAPSYMQDVPRSEEDVKRITREIRKELGDDFTVGRVGEIFFVASNTGSRTLERCEGTLRRMYDFLYSEFLTRKPAKPIRVYLFRDKESYDAYCNQAYEKPPSTPFGFYMSCERKMVMNIATGTGTLAHELVHPLLAEDFPEVPSWFNEGFASLYEQSRQADDGRMEGLVNWRLPSLQRALRNGYAVSLRKLTETTTKEFYGDNTGLHYATARYLCLYLQEQGKLIDFYREFKNGFQGDATGASAIEKVTGQKLVKLEEAWKRWVATLRYDD